MTSSCEVPSSLDNGDVSEHAKPGAERTPGIGTTSSPSTNSNPSINRHASTKAGRTPPAMSKADPDSAFVMTTNIYAVAGRLGITNGMDTSEADVVTEDGGGTLSTNYIVDLSHCMSEQLGKQLPMMATYRVLGFHISLRNQDDALDNNYGLAVGGRIDWFCPTKHRVNALQYAREYKRVRGAAMPNDQHDPFSFWTDDKKYSGLRFNWAYDSDGIEGAMEDDTSAMTEAEFNLADLFSKYNEALGGTPGEEGYDSGGGTGDALWETRTGWNNRESLYWNAYYRNSAFIDNAVTNSWSFEPETGPWDNTAPVGTHYPVLGGLLKVAVSHSNTDNPRAADVNDDYFLQFGCLVAGWEEF